MLDGWRTFRLRLQWQHWLVLIGVGLGIDTQMVAVNGSRGLLAWPELDQQIEVAERELSKLRRERAGLEGKVARLQSAALDADLIDELARRQLSLADPRDVIILLDKDEVPRRHEIGRD